MRYKMMYYMGVPEPRQDADGYLTWAECREIIIDWYVARAEDWLNKTEDDWNATPF
jgi:hypothetical protein